MKIKPFKQFLNEFEVEGNPQTPSYHYYKCFNKTFQSTTYMVSNLGLDDFRKTKSPSVEVEELPYLEAKKINQVWYYTDSGGSVHWFNIKTNKPFNISQS